MQKKLFGIVTLTNRLKLPKDDSQGLRGLSVMVHLTYVGAHLRAPARDVLSKLVLETCVARGPKGPSARAWFSTTATRSLSHMPIESH